MTTARHTHALSFSSQTTADPGDRNGEPVEQNYGCLIMAALILALGVVTAIIVIVSVV
jgi:hypothetical protein